MSAKALLNFGNTKSDASKLAQKAEKALETYPFDDISPAIALKINPRAKRMALRLDVKKRVVNLVIPKRGSMRSAYLFALEHKYWIRHKIDELPDLITFENGVQIPILGVPHEIKVTLDTTLKTTSIELKNKEILVFSNKEDVTSRIKRFIVAHAKAELTALANKKANEINKIIECVDVKDTSSRWGSCSYDGRISFSWRLIFAPMEAFDYVVAHEVAHLQHMDHSPAFWHACEDLSANYSKGKTWMKRHSEDLIRYN